jgi:hypothetical protein
VTHVSRGKRPPRQDEPPLSDGAWKLIEQCWAAEPPKRPTMKDVTEQMMAISQSVSPPNDEMLQDTSLSRSTSSTTVRRTKVVPSTTLY